MDIDLLSKMVKEMIMDNDKVVLPGLGCFVAEIVPAAFSDKGYTINPPYRKLYFRAKPDEGDALVRIYAESNDIDFSVADRIIRDFLSELKSLLYVRKTVVFPGLGRMRATKENNLFFVADEDLDIFPAGFGLESVSLKTHNETKEEVCEAVAGLKSILTESPSTVEPVPALPEPEPELELKKSESEQSEPEPEPKPEHQSLADTVKDYDNMEPQANVAEPSGKKTGKTILKILSILFLVALLLLAAYVAIGRLCPELLDRFLYTPAELEILNY